MKSIYGNGPGVHWIRPLKHLTVRCVAGQKWGILVAEVAVNDGIAKIFRADIGPELQGVAYDAALEGERAKLQKTIENWIQKHMTGRQHDLQSDTGPKA